MTNVKRIALVILFLALASSPLVIAQTTYSKRAKEIGMHLKCQCRGCDMTATFCSHPGGAFSGPCTVPEVGAQAMLHQVDELLNKGMSEPQIMDAFVAKYGSVVYAEPPTKGFGLVAWLMPIVYSVVGLALVIFIVRKWTIHHALAVPAGGSVPNEALVRARAQIDRETED
jgi:Cytochrome C biogenesis protein